MAASNPQTDPVNDTQILSATYQSPTNDAFTSAHQLPAPPSDKPADRTAYLGALRKAAVSLQEQINTQLTARMEEDKARGAEATSGIASAKGVDEAKEEDTYGEEVPEEE